MLSRVILATVAAVAAFLVCVFVGGVLLAGTGVPIAIAVGGFLNQYATVIAILVGLWYFFSGMTHGGK